MTSCSIPPGKKTIKELRSRANLSQKELGEAIGVSQATINAWEKSVGDASIRNIKTLADFFGVKIDDIFLN